MAIKLRALRQIVLDVGSVFPDLTPGQQIYLAPKIIAVPSMAPLEIQICTAGSQYEDIEGGCRSEDFIVLVGIFRKFRLDSGERHAKALSDLNLAILKMKELVIGILDGNFLIVDTTTTLLTRPLVIKGETEISETKFDGQLLQTLQFIAGLNSTMGVEYAEYAE